MFGITIKHFSARIDCGIWSNLISLTCDYKTNVMGTLNMLGLAKRIGARFLLTSTSEVYGDPLEHPQKETYWGHVNPIGGWCCSLQRCVFLFLVNVALVFEFNG